MNSLLKHNLERPFPVNRIHWRVGATNGDKSSGIALAYIDARDVMMRLDEAVGFENWQVRYTHADRIIIAEIGISTNKLSTHPQGHWIWRANGAGETAVEGEKGGASDAFKRAAVMWGIGRYLYSLPNIWVPVQQRGKSVILPDESKKQLIERLPKWATPEGYDEIMKNRGEEK